MSKSRDFLQLSDNGLDDFISNVIFVLDQNLVKWNMLPAPQSLKDALTEYKAKLKLSNNPNRGLVDVKAKNVAKKALIKEFRPYFQGFIARNPFVTEEDRVALHLPMRDTTPTPVLDPKGFPTVKITLTRSGQLTVNIIHDDAEQEDPRSYYGCRIYYGVYEPGETPPSTGKDLRLSMFSRKKKELIIFEPEDSGKIAWFSIRYENSKGKAGPWGPLVSAMIP